MEIPAHLPKFCKPLSVKVAEILNEIGASEDLRRASCETAIKQEILETVSSREHCAKFSCYIFGSSSEGTTTFGLHSDVDHLISNDTWEVFQNESELTSNVPVSLLLVDDPITKPGYVKLQLSLFGSLQANVIPDLGLPPNELQLDNKGRVVTSKRFYIASSKDEQHGPAFTVPASPGYAAKDMVQAFRCRTWPKAALKWFERIDGLGWPTEEMVHNMKTRGFFLVPVGHQGSPEKDLEWRISLSQQERILVQSFNPTQFHCYILLKMIKKNVLPIMISVESLTSYHCKTCLFHMIENTPSSAWRPDNVLACLQGCLNCLCQWASNRNCPNYFIREENMFEGRISEDVLGMLKIALENLASSNFEYLLQIKSDGFSRKLYQKCTYISGDDTENKGAKLFIYLRHYPSILMARNGILNLCSFETPDKTLQSLLISLRRISRIETVTEHTEEETKRALDLVLPYVEMSFLSTLIVHQATNVTDQEDMWKYLACSNWKHLRQSSDMLSARLKQATLMYMSGFKQASFEILDYLLELISYPPHVVSACYCRRFTPGRSAPEAALHSADVDFDWFHKNNVAPCVVFLPDEQSLIPVALCFEMIRSVGMPPFSRHILKDCWYDWAVVDGKFLLYFLLFLHYKEFDFGLEPVYIMFMEHLLLSDDLLGHKETALNLLGWAYKEQGQLEKAFECFQRSLQLQKLHNAAFWHICVIVNSEVNKNLNVSTH